MPAADLFVLVRFLRAGRIDRGTCIVLHLWEEQIISRCVLGWRCSPSGFYTAKDTYKALCEGFEKMEGASWVWQSWAPLKCKIFAWLALKGRLWTSDRRCRHGLQDEVSPCYTCLQEEDTVQHILVNCPYARQVWFKCARRLQVRVGLPQLTDSLQLWWRRERSRFSNKDRRGLDTFVILGCWRLWKQRNARVFHNTRGQFSVSGLVEQIIADWNLWRSAGLGGSNSFARVVH